MRSPGQTPFGAIFQAEVRLNSKRFVPYAMIILFSANALLWWGWGAAVHFGWATNSDFYIVRNIKGFSIVTLPLFTALIMGDAVIRDFRMDVDSFIFSKPVSRATYLLGKFFGNFFVLVCCQMAFVLTLVLLQGFRTSQMVVQPVRVIPYFKSRGAQQCTRRGRSDSYRVWSRFLGEPRSGAEHRYRLPDDSLLSVFS